MCDLPLPYYLSVIYLNSVYTYNNQVFRAVFQNHFVTPLVGNE